MMQPVAASSGQPNVTVMDEFAARLFATKTNILSALEFLSAVATSVKPKPCESVSVGDASTVPDAVTRTTRRSFAAGVNAELAYEVTFELLVVAVTAVIVSAI